MPIFLGFQFKVILNLLIQISPSKLNWEREKKKSRIPIGCTFKVHIFWEGHKILQNLPLTSVCTVVKNKGKISQNFVSFSEYLNFTGPV